MDRNKNTFDDFLEIEAGTGTGTFVDVNFPLNDALYWEDAAEAGGISLWQEEITWKRVSSFQDRTLWGPRGINPGDIN